MYTIRLRKGKSASLKRFHPWVFSGAVACLPPETGEGDLVRVEDADGSFLAVGHYERSSIAVRILSFEPRDIDAVFWHERLSAAFRLRQSLHLVGENDNAMFRLVHGVGDGLPGLVIDVDGDTAVMQAHSAGMHLCRQAVADALPTATGGLVHHVYYKSETTLPGKAGLAPENGFLVGGKAGGVATEYGLRFHVDWEEGQKTGFFVDQRENRRLLETYAAGRKVLNMFCYTGGFSVSAMRGGAASVHSVDSSAKAMALTQANIDLNFPGDSRHKGITEDAFRFLGTFGPEAGYDLIVLDPPAFAKRQGAVRNALKGYTRLNAAAIERVAHGGFIFTFSCSQAVSKEQFRQAVLTAAIQCGRPVRVLHQLHQPADHPVNIYHPEGEYLKGLVLYVE